MFHDAYFSIMCYADDNDVKSLSCVNMTMYTIGKDSFFKYERSVLQLKLLFGINTVKTNNTYTFFNKGKDVSYGIDNPVRCIDTKRKLVLIFLGTKH